MEMRISLRGALLLGLSAALIVALLPAGLALDRTLGVRLEEAARADLERAPMVLMDRNAALGDALMMHAREVAGAAAIAEAVRAGEIERVGTLLARSLPRGEQPVLVGAAGEGLIGPRPNESQLEAVRRGEAPVRVVERDGRLYTISVAPMILDGGYVGAAGAAMPVDDAMAATLARLTDSDVLILVGHTVVASTLELAEAERLAPTAARLPMNAAVEEIDLGERRLWMTATPMGDAGRVVFFLDRAEELSLLPELRQSALLALLLALLMALMLGGILATVVTRRVRVLATAADRLASGDFHAPLQSSRLEEVDRMSGAFARMRAALQARLDELSLANAELEERQNRLQALQSELIRRDRLAAGARLVTELAHEIRNPVANVRNCLELVRRRLTNDPEGREFADLAIDELLRMHELAEQMLDLNRPLDPGTARARTAAVVRQVVALYRAGSGDAEIEMEIAADAPDVAMPPDALKQVLLNLVQNAREAMADGGVIRLRVLARDDRALIEVADDGPGIPPDRLDRIFDPFYSTKREVSGVGLGLFVADGLLRKHGGTLTATNRENGSGAVFTVEMPLASPSATEIGDEGG